MVLAAFLFVKRVADTTQVSSHDEDLTAGQGHERVENLPRGVLVYRVFGALMFGAADKLDNVMLRANADTRVVILHLAALTALDGTALNALDTLHEKLHRHGRHLLLEKPGAHTQPYALMEKMGFFQGAWAETTSWQTWMRRWRGRGSCSSRNNSPDDRSFVIQAFTRARFSKLCRGR